MKRDLRTILMLGIMGVLALWTVGCESDSDSDGDLDGDAEGEIESADGDTEGVPDGDEEATPEEESENVDGDEEALPEEEAEMTEAEEEIPDGDFDLGESGDGEIEGEAPVAIGINPLMSDCGGFGVEKKSAFKSEMCGDETLAWTYSAETHTLSLVNTTVFLNCCGEHSISALFHPESGLVEIVETDAPEGGTGRCNCMCLFDFSIDVPDVSGTLDLRITRNVTDGGDPWNVWEGELDLSAGSGSEVIEEDVGWCDRTDLGANPRLSECGGFAEERALKSEEPDYCGDERLAWTYDSTTHTVSFLNTGVALNCCGSHSVSVYLDGTSGMYEIFETDYPIGEEGRCACTCLFDFGIDLPDVSGPIAVKITRLVAESAEIETVWEGMVNLTLGPGNVLIEANVGMCERANLGEHPVQSACGGFPDPVVKEEPACADELLQWTYSEESQTVAFLNTDVILNCCGLRSIAVYYNDVTGVYEISEVDEPESGGGGGRCFCECLFDFGISLPGVSGSIDLQLFRTVTDLVTVEPVVPLWEGTLDLTQNSGVVTVVEHNGICP